MDIGKRIASLRKKQGLTQDQLAEILGTTRQAVSKWESGKSSPDIDYVVQIGAHFGVSTDYLLLGKEDVSTLTPLQSQHKNKLPWYSVLLFISGCYTLLLPLIAKLYQVILSEYESVLTASFLYLFRWPLVSLVIIDIFMIYTGIKAYLRVKHK